MLKKMVAYVGYCCAMLVANIWCPAVFHQEKEPESVKKLRKF